MKHPSEHSATSHHEKAEYPSFFQRLSAWVTYLGLLLAVSFSACTSLLDQPMKPGSHQAGARLGTERPIVLGYFPSWSETWLTNGVSKFTTLPAHITHVFFSFGKPNLRYTKGSYDLSQTGIQVPYDGQMLKQAIGIVNQKGIKVILSLGGETYWASSDAYSINYSQIKDLVDDFGFAGIDWDFEPNGSFQDIGSPANVAHFIDFFNQSRAIMPRSGGYILACAPAGVGALGGLNNDDPAAKYAYAKRNTLTGEPDTYLYSFTDAQHSISQFGFSSTGHMIPVFKAVGDKIDIVAYQGYNIGAAPRRTLLYDAYAYYANTYGFKLAAGTHVPNEPWGPYYTYSAQKAAELAQYIREGGAEGRAGKGDGIMIWQLLAQSQFSGDANYTGVTYLNVASKVLNGATPAAAIAAAFDYNTTTPPPTTGPAAPTVSSTTGVVNTAITGQVASTGTLLISKDGVQLATQTLTGSTWNYTPTSAGAYSFKLQTPAGTSAASATVTVTAASTGGGTGGCGYPAYNPAQAYPTAGTRVYVNGKIYQNQWYANPNEGPDESQQWGNWKFVQNCAGGSTNPPTSGPAAPTVNSTTGVVNTAVSGQVASAGTLLILKNGTQVATQSVSSGGWSYTPTSAGTYSFKLQTSAGTSAASVSVSVTAASTGGGTGGCGYPAYNSTQAYPTAGTRVFYNGKIYESKWYVNANEAPDDSQQWGAWKFIQTCN
ncbi:hypothetical protein ACAW74_27220 [Fibrella sp. WM1]|uniref:hypothetical protein n=1 Tax=Fibrella musci TaxID=3242485 RepID=UPI0035209DD9